jgi:hypothetical protein
MVSQVESCYSDAQTYSSCTDAGSLGNTGLALGTNAGEVTVSGGTNVYTITASSKSGNTFKITKLTDGTVSRTCTAQNTGSCLSSGTW